MNPATIQANVFKLKGSTPSILKPTRRPATRPPKTSTAQPNMTERVYRKQAILIACSSMPGLK
jgi:hypothetical protein